MKTEVKLITPSIAEKLLQSSKMNRFLRSFDLKNYERQMSAGLWREDTGESIKISTDGFLIDGHHRLTALINAGVSLNFLIVSELESDIFKVIDSGAKRTTGDILHISGIANANKVAAGIRRYFILRANKYGRDHAGISSPEVYSMYTSRSSFWDAAINMSTNWYNKAHQFLTSSDIVAFYAFFFDINQDDAFTFITNLCEGENLDNKDPIKQLREKLLTAKMDKKFSMTATLKTALIFRAWNYFRAGTFKLLKFDTIRDKFPIPE